MMKRKKIPRKAIEPLMRHCESLSKESDETAAEIFEEYLELMNKYADYVFSEPWPKKYDYEKATTFTDEDIEFLTEWKEGEAAERFRIMLLKKNMNVEHGFMELFGPFWTSQAFHEEFVRPGYKPVQEAFDVLSAGDEAPRGVLDELKRVIPRDERGRHKHQLHRRLSEDAGHPALREHLASIVGIMKGYDDGDWDGFLCHLDRAHPRFGDTRELPFPKETT